MFLEGPLALVTCQKICKSKGGLTRHINQKHNEDSPAASQKQDQTLKLECIFDLLKEEKLKAEENMCYNKKLCIKLKETKLMIKISGCQQQICVLTSVSHLKNYFRIKMQRSFIVFVTLILYSNRVNIYLKFLKTWHGYYYH